MKYLRALLVVAVALWPAMLLGQGRATSGDVVGVVLDTSSAAVATATVTATHVETRTTRIVTSGASGRFELPALPLGRYELTIERSGFWPITLSELDVPLGAPVQLEIRMTPSTITEHVSVVGALDAAVPQMSAASMVVPENTITALPANGRNFVAFSLLAPGVAPDQTPQQGASRTSGLTFAGQRARSNNITVDGLDNNDEVVGSVRAFFSQEAVREFEVMGGTPTAEFGKASGGVVNVVTKAGGNTPAGSVFGFLRDRALNAKNYFERLTPSGERIDQPKAPFSQKQYGATFGGPIQRNSSFFFVSFERSNAEASNFVTIDDRTPVRNPLNPAAVLGTPAGILRAAGFPVETGYVPYSMVLNEFLARVDRHSPAHTLTGRISAATELNENIEPFGGLVARSRAAALHSTDVSGALSDMQVLSTRTINEVRGQVALRNQVVRSLDPRCGEECLTEADGGPTLEVTGVASVGRQRFTPTLRDNTRYQVLDTLSHYRGRHQLRAGIDASYIHGRRQTLPLHFGGRYIFQDISLPLVPGLPPIPLTAVQEVALGLPLAYVQGYGMSGLAANFTDLSLFGQDTWRLGESTTINAGIRYQRQFWPDAVYHPAGYPGTYAFSSDGNNIGPRMSIAWRPGQSRSTVLRGGYGVYYDNLITSVFNITKYVSGEADGVRTLVLRAPGSFAAWSAPGHRLSETSALQLSGGSYPSLAITIDPEVRTPYAHHLTVGVQRVLPGAVKVAADALYVRGYGQIGTIDYNPIVPALGAGRRPADINGAPGSSASVLQYTSFGETWYRGLLLSAERRARDGSTLLVSYTLGKGEDTSTDFQSAFLPQDNGRGRNPGDPNGLPLGFIPRAERGPSVQDIRHRLVVSGTQRLPGEAQFAAILTVASGLPYNILAGLDLNGDGDGGSPSPDRARRNPVDQSSSVGRNAGRLPGEASLDIRVSRTFRARGRVVIDPMIDVFNLLNRTNFTGIQNVFGPGVYPTSPLPTYGQFNKAAAGRQAQVAVKLGF